MTKENVLRPAELQSIAKGNPSVFLHEDFVMFRNFDSIKNNSKFELLRRPQFVELGRIVMINKGEVHYRINLIEKRCRQGDILIIPEYNYISCDYFSEDFDGEMVSFNHIPVNIEQCLHLRVNENEYKRIGKYVDLLWCIAHEAFDWTIIKNIQTALLRDLQLISDHDKNNQVSLTRSKELFAQFLALHQKEKLPRNIKAYASALCVSPNYLSAIVKKESGQSVMDWINAHCILQAQVMLLNTNKPIYEIADELGFKSATFFTRFFHNITGQTPKEYRMQNT